MIDILYESLEVRSDDLTETLCCRLAKVKRWNLIKLRDPEQQSREQINFVICDIFIGLENCAISHECIDDGAWRFCLPDLDSMGTRNVGKVN